MKILYTLLILLIPFVGFGQIPSYVSQDGLVGWWPFNGNANDETGNGNNGIINDAVLTSDRFGNYENAYNYNGANTFITLPNDFFNGAENGNYTINLWTKHNSTEVPVFTKGGSWKKSYIYITSLDKVEYGFRNGTNTDFNILESNISLDLDIWYNICITHTDDEIKLYINGILDSQLQTSDIVDWSTSTNTPCAAIGMHLGKDYNGCTIDNGFYGVIDDFGIWNRALSNEEVLQIYNSEDCVDTSYSEITACESYEWNGEVYTESGTYEYSGLESNNNYSMSFDGYGDYINLGNSDVFYSENNEYTICAWIKPYDLISDQGIISHMNGDGGGGYNIITNGSSIRLEVSGSQLYTTPIATNQWQFITATINNSVKRIYIDGVLVSEDFSEEVMPTNDYLMIGAHQPFEFPEWSWNGLIDDVHIWSNDLTQQEIQQLMNCPPSGNESGLVGYWNFEEGEGNTVYDLSGNGNDGTINGATYDTNVPTQFCQLTTINGCDSVAVLNLTINQPDTSYTTITACDEFTWDGQTYTESGEYTNTYTNANGCDSTVIIDLTIFESINENIIYGNPEPDQFSVSLYSASNNGNNLVWLVDGGNIIENNGNSINIQWGNQGIGLITLIESNDICDDFTNVFTVNIGGQVEPTWDCNNDYACVELSDGSGNFQSLEECEANCNPIEDSWNCLNDACVDPLDGSGEFSTLNDCEQVCQNISSISENLIDVNIYPNPSSNIFNLEFNSNSETEISVTNILGEQVYFESTNSIGEFNTQIDLSNYSKGIYNLTIKTSDGISNHKLILQ